MVAAVLLAAGSGSRFDGETHKLLAPLRGRAVVAHALDAVRASGLEVYVVTGAVDLADVLADDVHIVHNPDWADGQATSVRAAIEAATADGHDAVVVGLGDQPFVTADAWRAVAAADDLPLAVATYGGRRGHPVRLDASVWELLPTTGDEVGRVIMQGRPDLVRPIPCAGHATDIDTLEDLHRWT
ncbi:MAG: nucleotidyltransferase family protein [Acidimicrobiales bacterium]|nr:nucleotidyltransferase family protein [Acidimicrobiales bacterium]